LWYTEEVSSSSFTRINVSNLTKGIYFLKVQTSKENITQKIIIQ
jgi:hypothetical protein